MIKNKYSPHSFALCSLFVLGSTVVTMPFYKSGLLTYLASVLFSIFLLLVMGWLIKIGEKHKTLLYITTFVICAAAIIGFVTSVFDYLFFLKAIQLPNTRMISTAVAFAAVVSALFTRKTEVIYKYALFVWIAVVVIIFLCLLGGIKAFEFNNFKASVISFSAKDFFTFSSPIVSILPLTTQVKATSKTMFFGITAGFTMLGICICQAVLTLGINTNASYPYLRAVSTISTGSLFTRLDGMIFFLFFVTSLIKITICIKSVTLLVRKLKNYPHH